MARSRGDLRRHTLQPSPNITPPSVELCPQQAFSAHTPIDRTAPIVVGVSRRMWPMGTHR